MVGKKVQRQNKQAFRLSLECRSSSNSSSTSFSAVVNKTAILVFLFFAQSTFTLVVEGKAAAMRFRCKYIEVAAVFNHRLDELLVGIIKQMRLKLLVKIFKKIKMENQRDKRMKLACGDDDGFDPCCLDFSSAKHLVGKSSAECRDVKVTRVIISSC